METALQPCDDQLHRPRHSFCQLWSRSSRWRIRAHLFGSTFNKSHQAKDGFPILSNTARSPIRTCSILLVVLAGIDRAGCRLSSAKRPDCLVLAEERIGVQDDGIDLLKQCENWYVTICSAGLVFSHAPVARMLESSAFLATTARSAQPLRFSASQTGLTLQQCA